MAELTLLRKKIQSIKTTKKITHAVRLVSMSLYSRLEKQRETLQNYQNTIFKLFCYTQIQNPEWKNKILIPGDILDSKPLFIIISTSKGLCGSLNSNLLRYLQKTLTLEPHQEAEIITIGHKAQKFLPDLILPKNTRSILGFNELTSSNYQKISKDIIDIIYRPKKPYSSVVFFSNKIKNFFVQNPSKTTIIPATLKTEEEIKQKDLIWTENSDIIMNSLAKLYLKSSIFDVLFQAILAEQAARFIAMDNATNNAENYLDLLTLQFNKTRQALITKEVSELSSGLQD
ncbi:MAG: FoF1 ATP synthase subunit gamma [bacterium]